MAYSSWAPLWSGIIDSSLWDESDSTIKIFITMLAMKDSDHVCRATVYGLSKKTGKSQAEVLDAIKVLSEPDTRRVDHQEFEGRRIEAVEEGWLILNGEKYRELVSKEMERARNRRSQAAWRERQKKAEATPNRGQPLHGERRYEEALRNGDHEAADRILNEGLPEASEASPEPQPPEIPELE